MAWHGMPARRGRAGARPNGTVFVGTHGIGRVYAVGDTGAEREVGTLRQGLTQPSGLAMRDGALYVSAINRMLRIDKVEPNLATPQPVAMTAAVNLPDAPHHGWTRTQFGPGGRLSVPRINQQRGDFLVHTLAECRHNLGVGTETQMKAMMLGMLNEDIRAVARDFAHR